MRKVGVLFMLALAGVLTWWWVRPAPDEQTHVTDSVPSAPTLAEQAQAALKSELSDAGTKSFEGQVVTADDQPVANATVQIFVAASTPSGLSCPVCELSLLNCDHPSSARRVLQALIAGSFFPSAIATTTSAADGTYHFEDVPDVDLYVIARAGSLAGGGTDERVQVGPRKAAQVQLVDDLTQSPVAGAHGWVVDSQTFEAIPVTTSSDGWVKALTFQEEPMVYVDDPRFLPQGTTMSDDVVHLHAPRTLILHTKIGGEPADATVEMTLHGPPQTFHAEHGVLRLDDLAPGSFSVTASARGFTSLADISTHELLVTEHTLELRASARVLLTVVDEQGQPLENINASLDSSETSTNATTKTAGEMLVLGPVPEGDYLLTVTGDADRFEFREQLDLTPGDHPHEVRLHALSQVTGIVTDDKGPVANAMVRIMAPGLAPIGSRTSDDGHFSMNCPALADAVVTASQDSSGRASVHTAVPAGNLALHLSPRASVHLSLTGPHASEVGELRVALGSKLSNLVEDVTMQAVGRGSEGTVRGLSPGVWSLEVEGEASALVTRELTLVDGVETQVAIELNEGATISGHVVDAQGQPIPSATVMAASKTAATHTNDAGYFELRGLEGKVSVSAFADSNGEDYDVPTVEVSAPTQGLVLRAKPRNYVTGHVVDEHQRPITVFDANNVTVSNATGAFKVALREKTLTIFNAEYESFTQDFEPGDIGTVVLHAQRTALGEVVDAQGRPVAGARVWSNTNADGATVLTAADGSFKLAIGQADPTEKPTITASRGSQQGAAPIVTGGRTHVVLQRGHQVLVRVSRGGRPASRVEVVIIPTEAGGDPRRSLTGDDGTFRVELWSGQWSFAAVGAPATRVVTISGDTEVELGGALGTCSLDINAPQLIQAVQINLAASGSSASAALRFDELDEPQVHLESLPCGPATVSATFARVVDEVTTLTLGPKTTWVIPLAAPEPPAEPTPEKEAPAKEGVVGVTP